MDLYHNYQEFLDDLTAWGSHAAEGDPQFQPRKSFLGLLQKARRSAEHDVFSPFLYLALSARLNQEELMLLAASFYMESKGSLLTFSHWELFLEPEEPDFPGAELYVQSAPLIFDREQIPEKPYVQLRIVPEIFLFLQGVLLDLPCIPGMHWYHHIGQPLSPLGKNIRLYENIQSCLSKIPGQKLVYLQGAPGSGRKLNYAWLASQSHMSLAVISYETLQTREQLRKMQTACLLHHAMFVIELAEQEEDLEPLFDWLREEETIFLLGTKPNLRCALSAEREYLPFSIQTRKVLEDRELFDQITLSFSWECEQVRRDFLNRYNFLPGRMSDILKLARSLSLSCADGAITKEHLNTAILEISSHSLDQYATKIETLYRGRDLILPESAKAKLTHIINRIRNRKLIYETWGFLEKSAYGNGTSMIFAGPPGTGKTMAAQVMAAELGMELYRVELPAIVDKYIGETEKKLNRIFGEAEKSMAILFFDEADVLFSKRTEIKESTDKYSNMEIAFLLQKMEEYEGVSILATNYLQNFDSAFRRRVSDIVDFPLPDAALRRQMWQSMIPSKLPVSDEIDFDFLAQQFEMSGSMIKNALIYASFLTAETQEPSLTMEQLLKGISHELEKSGKKLSRGEYGEYGHLF